MRSNELAVLAGASYRQIDYWVRCGYLEPYYQADEGPGSRREFPAAEAVRARALADVSRATGPRGHDLKVVAAALRALDDAELHGGLDVRLSPTVVLSVRLGLPDG